MRVCYECGLPLYQKYCPYCQRKVIAAPSPGDIKRECKLIKEGWKPVTRRSREGYRRIPFTLPVIHEEDCQTTPGSEDSEGYNQFFEAT